MGKLNNQKRKKWRNVSYFINVIIAVGLLAAMPQTVKAQTVLIDISTLGGSDTDNSVNSAEAQWEYIESDKMLKLTTMGGIYMLTGTNSSLNIDVQVLHLDLVLDGVDITATGDLRTVMNLYGVVATISQFRITLVGTNIVKGRITSANNYLTFTGSGSLTVLNIGSYYGSSFAMSCGFLDIKESATVTLTSDSNITSGSGAALSINRTGLNISVLTIEKQAKLIIDPNSMSYGIECGPCTMNIDGVLIARGRGSSGYGLNVGNGSSFNIDICGTGSITFEGDYGSMNVGSLTPPIGLCDCIILTLINGVNSGEKTYNFTKSNTPSLWDVTPSSYISDPLNGIIKVIIPSGTTAPWGEKICTIQFSGELWCIPKKPGDVNGDDMVDATDLSILISDFGKSSGFNNPASDVNNDGQVDATDLSILISNFGN